MGATGTFVASAAGAFALGASGARLMDLLPAKLYYGMVYVREVWHAYYDKFLPEDDPQNIIYKRQYREDLSALRTAQAAINMRYIVLGVYTHPKYPAPVLIPPGEPWPPNVHVSVNEEYPTFADLMVQYRLIWLQASPPEPWPDIIVPEFHVVSETAGMSRETLNPGLSEVLDRYSERILYLRYVDYTQGDDQRWVSWLTGICQLIKIQQARKGAA